MRFRIKENIYEKNNNNDINKKYKKSMSPFVSLDVGNVPYNIMMFNKGNGTKELSNDSTLETSVENISIGEAFKALNEIKDTDIIDDIIIQLKPGLDWLEDK